MNTKRIFITFTLIVISTILSAQTIKVGSKAPDFSLTLSSGEKVTLSDYKETSVMLHFWATWCPPCIRELPEMNKLSEALTKDKNSKLTFLAICVSDQEKTRASFMNRNKYTFTGGLDEKGTLANLYGIDGIPASILIEKGIVKKVSVGAMTKTQLSTFVSDYVKF